MDRIEQRSSHLCEDCFVGVSNTVEQYYAFLRRVTVDSLTIGSLLTC